MNSIVVGIYTSAVAGRAMVPVAEATLETGKGVVGDRYYAGVGTFSKKLKGKPDVEVTLIESEEIDPFNSEECLSVPAGDFRRNIVTRGIRLNRLVGQQFRVGATLLEGLRLCEPCAHLAEFVGSKVLPAFVHRAGLRARIVSGGTVRLGDLIGGPIGV